MLALFDQVVIMLIGLILYITIIMATIGFLENLYSKYSFIYYTSFLFLHEASL